MVEDISKGLTERVIGCALRVHRNLGPGLLESVYRQCLAYELSKAGLPFRMEVALPVQYEDVKLYCGYRMDMVVDDILLLELKSIEKLLPVHEAQLMTYLTLAKLPVGLLINFNVNLLKSGIRRRAMTRRQHTF